MNKKIKLFLALLSITILVSSVTLFISPRDICYYSHGWPAVMYSRPVEFVPEDTLAPDESSDEYMCNSVPSIPIHIDAIAWNAIFWFLIVVLIYWIVQKIRRKPNAHKDSTDALKDSIPPSSKSN